MKQLIKIAACLLLAVVTVALVGCGKHSEDTPSAAVGPQATPPGVIPHTQGANMGSYPPPTASTAPLGHHE